MSCEAPRLASAISPVATKATARGRLTPGAVRRVAIVGPGLDFADKDVGFDVYAQQTLQPFAVLDALDRERHAGLGRRRGDRVAALRPIAVLRRQAHIDVLAGAVPRPAWHLEHEAAHSRRLVDHLAHG